MKLHNHFNHFLWTQCIHHFFIETRKYYLQNLKFQMRLEKQIFSYWLPIHQSVSWQFCIRIYEFWILNTLISIHKIEMK